MQKENKELAIGFFAILAVIVFFTPIFATYKYGDGVDIAIIPLAQWILARKLWERQFDTKKTLLLWILMSVLLIVAVFLRDYVVVVYLGKEAWHHSIQFYIYIGLASTFWWTMVNMLDAKMKSTKKQ